MSKLVCDCLKKIQEHDALRQEILLCVTFSDFFSVDFYPLYAGSKIKPFGLAGLDLSEFWDLQCFGLLVAIVLIQECTSNVSLLKV